MVEVWTEGLHVTSLLDVADEKKEKPGPEGKVAGLLGSALNDVMQQKNITAPKLEELTARKGVPVSRATIGRVLRGEWIQGRRRDRETLPRLEEALELRAGYLTEIEAKEARKISGEMKAVEFKPVSDPNKKTDD